eukprot:TRINITY_DN22569_c0_g1_i1.p1 TRINITY_DN22569_c0_g1~~TRINITY_DN22569_c0_g1_i1.p1  ORF type:complete len:206 (-),score=49.68 TRINITY_DN22569_c0_g1_i1:166-783(-)
MEIESNPPTLPGTSSHSETESSYALKEEKTHKIKLKKCKSDVWKVQQPTPREELKERGLSDAQLESYYWFYDHLKEIGQDERYRGKYVIIQNSEIKIVSSSPEGAWRMARSKKMEDYILKQASIKTRVKRNRRRGRVGYDREYPEVSDGEDVMESPDDDKEQTTEKPEDDEADEDDEKSEDEADDDTFLALFMHVGHVFLACRTT